MQLIREGAKHCLPLSNSGQARTFCTLLRLDDTQLTLDKISIILDMPRGKNEYIQRWYSNLTKVIRTESDKDYSDNQLFKLHSRFRGFDIQLGFKKSDDDYLRIEFNPCKQSLSDLEPLISMFPIHSYDRIRVSRLDIAVDVFGELHPLSFTDAFKRKGTIVFQSGGGVKTLYLGTIQSDVQICIYDKRLELLENEGLDLGTPCWRIEARVRKSKYLTESYKNPFRNLKYYEYKNLTDDFHFKCFLYYAKEVGMDCALKELSRRKREKYREYLVQRNEIKYSPSKVFDRCFSEVWDQFTTDLNNEFHRVHYSRGTL